MRTSFTRVVMAATVAALLGAAGRADAAFVTYTNLAAFQTAAGSTSVETFNSAPAFNTTGAFGPNVYNGFSLSGNGNGNNIGIHTGSVASSGAETPIPAAFTGQNFFGWGSVAGGAINGVTFNFTQPTTAFAFDWFNTDTTDQYQITFSGPATAATSFTAPPFTVGGTTGFFGVTSTTVFTTATITNVFNGGYISDEGFDNVRVGAAASVATPAPAGVVVLAAAAGLLGLGRRFRRTAA